MPLVIHPKLKKGGRVVVAAAALACFVGPGVAQAACPTAPLSQPFAKFGDTAYYTLSPGGGFESGMAAWTVSGGSIASGNETYFVRSSTDMRAMTVNALGSVTSPAICVDATYPSLRIFAKKLSGLKGTLKVELLYADDSGVARTVSAGSFSNDGVNFASWAPSPSIRLGTALPVNKTTGTLNVRLRFTADKTGAWAIDDVYADPYRSR